MLLLGQATVIILVQNAANKSSSGTTQTNSSLLQVKEILFRNAIVDVLVFQTEFAIQNSSITNHH